MQDLVAGRIDLSGLEASSSLPYVQAGKIKAFGVLTTSRWPGAPDMPTLEEAGLPGLDMPYWTGLWVKKGTPAEIVAKLNAAVVEAMADPAITRRLTDLGQRDPAARSADAAGAGRPAPRRHREMVADHQGGKHQGGLSQSTIPGG